MTITAGSGARTAPSQQIAREIRAEIGRQQTTVRRLSMQTGMSYDWFKRRLTACDVPMTFEDVEMISSALGVAPGRFLSATGWLPRLDSNQQPAGYAMDAHRHRERHLRVVRNDVAA